MGPDVPPGALITESESPAPSPAEPPERWRELCEVVLVAVIAALFVRTFLVQAFVVPSGSMEPTLLVGDHVLVNKFVFATHGRALFALLPYRDPRRGDVFVFKFPPNPAQDFIKRVVALPSDLVAIRDRQVLINGAPEARGPGSLPPAEPIGPLRVPPDAYFALGDNRASSYDSRFWGAVPAANVKGRALAIYWSVAPTHSEAASGNLISRLLRFWRRTRWERSFRMVK
jgi:signal peptidase I